MVKRICWFGRDDDFSPAEIDNLLRGRGINLPPGLPTAGWKQGGARAVSLSTERFPGSQPVWIWEE